ncbi:MAG TPA: IclR family transcriptional regulator C-terminal domain-containing protein [Candidatus Limnocylindrales bacterium]|nr:IclR family transcriptional regulator C-terminal domain-containing protein [Candidatus Limnocylindrales bacterium]
MYSPDKDEPTQRADDQREETLRPATEFSEFEGDPNFVLSLARGLKVIETFEGRTEGQSVAEIARSTGLSRAAVRRLLMTLQTLGYAESNGRVYRLKTRVLKLGFSYLSSASLPGIAQPVLEQVTEQVHESSSLSVLDGDQIVYVARSTAKRVMSVGLSVGSRLPCYCTSMGRVLLASLHEEQLVAYVERTELKPLTAKTITDKSVLADIIRRVKLDGFALADEELELGLRSIAVPVKTRHNETVAAMNIGVHAARVSAAEMIHRFLPILQENARMLGRYLG